MKFRQILLSSSLGLLAIFCSSPNKMEAVLASVKSTGMAATAIAYPQDSLAVAYNPAGMVAVGNRVDVEAGWLYDSGHAKISGSPVPGADGNFNVMRTHNYYLGNFGINTVWCTPVCGCMELNWSLGVALYNRDFQKATQNKVQPLFGTSDAGIEYVHEELATSFAVNICDGHSLGLSLDWHVARVKVNGLENFDNSTFSSNPGHVTNRGYNYSHGLGVTVGYYGQLTDWLSIGATYRPKVKMDRYEKYDGFFADRGRIDVPEKIGGGIAFDPWPCLTLCFDVEQLRWHSIKALSNKLATNTDEFVEDKLGTEDGSGFGFKNQTFYRIGAEYRVNDSWTLRLGYRHVNSLISASQTAANSLIDDLVENFVTAGFTWNYSACLEFSGFYAHGFKHTLHGQGAIPLTPFGGGNVKLDESKDVLAFALGWKW
jgi:long-chain fatty acid transport protein